MIEIKQMGWLEFVQAMTGHLAWPLVVLIVLFSVRKNLGSLVRRIVELSFGGATLKFGQLLSEGAEILYKVPEPSKSAEEPELKLEAPKGEKPITIPGRHPVRDNAHMSKGLQGKELWDTTATGQILNGYETVERTLLDIGDSLGIDAARGGSVMSVLRQKNAISKEWADLYDSLRNGRNLIAHARALPTADEVLEYLRQAEYLNSQLIFLQQKIDRGDVQ